jgi:hypothetical protein
MTNEDEAGRIRRELIEKRAYEIYKARGGNHGLDQEDWWQAEREVDGLPMEDDLLPEPEGDEVEEEKPSDAS